jgi:hypothetical protein
MGESTTLINPEKKKLWMHPQLIIEGALYISLLSLSPLSNL